MKTAAMASSSQPTPSNGPDAVERRLDQQPAEARRSLREQLQLALTQRAHQLVAQLSAAPHLQRDAGGRQRAAELEHSGVDLDRVGQAEVGAHVRGHHDGRAAVRDRRPAQLEAGVHVGRAVVDSGKQVEVQVDVCHPLQHRPRRGPSRDAPVTRVLSAGEAVSAAGWPPSS